MKKHLTLSVVFAATCLLPAPLFALDDLITSAVLANFLILNRQLFICGATNCSLQNKSVVVKHRFRKTKIFPTFGR